jgi:ketosteroid isomerase-like protein
MDEPLMKRPRSLRWLIPFALVVLVVSACSDSESEVPSEVLATVEGFEDAVNSYDTEAIGELVTDDYIWQSTGPVQDLDGYLAYVDTNYENIAFHTERTSDRVVTADGESYVVEEVGVVEFTGGELNGTTVHRLIETNDGWLIQESRWTEDPDAASG